MRLTTIRAAVLLLGMLPVASLAAAETAPVTRPSGGGPLVSAAVEEAAQGLTAAVREGLRLKPSPWLVKAHDVGAPTDFDTDLSWHALDRERDPRFDLPFRGKLGVVNPGSDVNVLIGLGVDDGPVNFSPSRTITDHLIDLLVVETDLGAVNARVAFLVTASDTLLVLIEARNESGRDRTVWLAPACVKVPETGRPVDRWGEGINVTTGALLGRQVDGPVTAQRYEDWFRNQVQGTLLCTQQVDGVDGEGVALGESEAAPPAPVRRYRMELPAKSARVAKVAVNLKRYGEKPLETRRGILLYPRMNDEEALAAGRAACAAALAADWPGLIRESYRWYERLPEFELPSPAWAANLYCCLELPRGNTWSPRGFLKQPWYTFTRVQGQEFHGWWSYGMHAHEHLSTFVVNLTEPQLSQSYLRGHFQAQRDDGYVPYGVNHQGSNIHQKLATCPFLMWEAWNAYLWSGDRAFLEEAYGVGGRYLHWWRSAARTRPGQRLQHWLDYVETVRDDKDLATWAATGGAEHQEALDLNCYLLNEERTLALMARELGRGDEAQRWEQEADARQALMRERLWHAEDGLYYGRDLVNDRWARVLDISNFFPLWCGLAIGEQAPRTLDLLRDKEAFDTAFPVATLGVKHMPERERGAWHWRGANWVEMSWLPVLGLKRYGFFDEAVRLAEANCRLVFDTLERTGHFREYYNTLTGEGAGLTDYLWTSIPAAMMVDVIYGIRPTAEGIEILPALPEGWRTVAVRNLRTRGSRLELSVRRGVAAATQATVNGRPVKVYRGRGVMIRWADLPHECRVEILQADGMP